MNENFRNLKLNTLSKTNHCISLTCCANTCKYWTSVMSCGNNTLIVCIQRAKGQESFLNNIWCLLLQIPLGWLYIFEREGNSPPPLLLQNSMQILAFWISGVINNCHTQKLWCHIKDQNQKWFYVEYSIWARLLSGHCQIFKSLSGKRDTTFFGFHTLLDLVITKC